MKNLSFYESPDIAEISVVTEKGFAGSPDGTVSSLDGYNIEDAEW